MSKSVCCVYNCTNSNKKAKALGIQKTFYSFPSRPWQKERREDWIRFARRKNADGSTWRPSKHSVICSDHFLGGKKSEHPHHPNYVPTLFHKSMPPSQVVETQKLHRFERAMNRATEKTRIPSESSSVNELQNNIQKCKKISPTNLPNQTVVDKATQVRSEMIDINLNPSILNRTTYHQPSFQGFDSVKDNSSALRDLTGVSKEVFELLISVLPRSPPKQTSLSLENKLLLTLMKLKCGNGLTFTALSALFNVDDRVISRAFHLMISQLYAVTSTWIFFPSKEAILDTMPDVFKEQYRSCRVIIDCTEMKTETPSTVDQKTHMYSNYKGCFTAKYLLGITPRGFISYISKGYGGRATDSYITNDCGILDLLEPGDTVMADKGFPNVNVQDNVVIVMPPFSKGKNYQFSNEEVDQTYNIASLRIHVERSIQRIKIFKILSTKIPISMLGALDKIVHICCVLVNLSKPIIK